MCMSHFIFATAWHEASFTFPSTSCAQDDDCIFFAIKNALTFSRVVSKRGASSYQSINTLWQHPDMCQETLQRPKEALPTLWVLCADDNSEEVLDFILPLHQKGKKILIIDTRSIIMPSLWMDYFTTGGDGLIVEPEPSDFIPAIQAIIKGNGVLKLPQQSQTILHETTPTRKLSIATSLLLEILFNSQLNPDLDPVMQQDFITLENHLLKMHKMGHLHHFLPELLTTKWLQKRQK